MKIQFVGAGSAFNKQDGQSNLLVISDSGKRLLIDCGSYCWQFMEKLGLGVGDIDAVYISHLHGDHIGGMEELAFCTYFNPTLERPKLYSNDQLMPVLWGALEPGLGSIQGKVVTLTEYFDCRPVPNNGNFIWEGIQFTPVQTVHVMAGYYVKYSYGLLIQEVSHSSPTVFITTDTQFCPNQIRDFYLRADLIFQDCETAPFKSGVHAHYSELKTLEDDIRSKMILYHYQPNPPQKEEETRDGETKQICLFDGFAGMAETGQIFNI